MPVIIAIAIYAVLFVSGTAISNNVSKPTPTPTPVQAPITPVPSVAERTLYKVLKVIDGDTLNVEINGKSNTIRLIGIDTPETVDPRKPVQCFGVEASDKAKELLNGKNVSLEEDNTQGDKDKYNRLLRYIYLEDGTSVNKYMISEGYAHEYTYQSNPYRYQAEYMLAEQSAREHKKGLWADNICTKPTQVTLPTKVTSTNTQSASGGFVCNCSKACDAMASCEEAYFQLNQCGCSKRDADGDGVPCESICN